jgi:hypothetical protein
MSDEAAKRIKDAIDSLAWCVLMSAMLICACIGITANK